METEIRTDLKGPDLDVFEIGPGGEKRPLPTAAEEQARFEREIDGDTTRRQQIIDEFMANEPSNNNTTHESEVVDAETQFRMAKAAYRLINEFPSALKARLAPLNLTVRGMLPDGDGSGYVVYIEDSERRPFTVKMGHEDTNDAFLRYGDSMGVKLVELIVERVVKAREKWFARMGGVAEKPLVIL